MAERSQALEWHDSVLHRISSHREIVDLCLRPGYLHVWENAEGRWLGRGYLQDLDVRIFEAHWSGAELHEPKPIADSELRISGRLGPTLLPLDSRYLEPVEIDLVLVSGASIRVRGSGLVVEIQGNRRFVENLPQDFAPGAETT